jgi:zinc and cadmium transporter
MTQYLQLIGLTLFGGVFSLFGGVLLVRNKRSAKQLAEYATPFAAGALLAAVFLDLLRDGIEYGNGETVLYATLGGILLFFMAERFLHWFHHHHEHNEEAASKTLIVIGDAMHNALDGIAIASAFLISPATGFVTTLAVAAHEIPQEIGDFGLLLNKGMSARKVILVNIISALATTLFAVLTFMIGNANALPTGLLLGISAGFLLYIALSDIIPDIHEQAPKNSLFDWRAILLLVGVAVVGLAINLAHSFIDTGH